MAASELGVRVRTDHCDLVRAVLAAQLAATDVGRAVAQAEGALAQAHKEFALASSLAQSTLSDLRHQEDDTDTLRRVPEAASTLSELVDDTDDAYGLFEDARKQLSGVLLRLRKYVRDVPEVADAS